ncbi:hypothetical protein ABKN59_001312 [Abortiporus biennis]
MHPYSPILILLFSRRYMYSVNSDQNQSKGISYVNQTAGTTRIKHDLCIHAYPYSITGITIPATSTYLTSESSQDSIRITVNPEPSQLSPISQVKAVQRSTVSTLQRVVKCALTCSNAQYF